jgi:hypothetical protein
VKVLFDLATGLSSRLFAPGATAPADAECPNSDTPRAATAAVIRYFIFIPRLTILRSDFSYLFPALIARSGINATCARTKLTALIFVPDGIGNFASELTRGQLKEIPTNCAWLLD